MAYVANAPGSGLIEAYWNVNRSPSGNKTNVSAFNRSILKCKSVRKVYRAWWYLSLIEAYWNVNTMARSLGSALGDV